MVSVEIDWAVVYMAQCFRKNLDKRPITTVHLVRV